MTVLDVLTPWRSAVKHQPVQSPDGSEGIDPRTSAETESEEGKQRSGENGHVMPVLSAPLFSPLQILFLQMSWEPLPSGITPADA